MFYWILIGNVLALLYLLYYDLVKHNGYFFSKLSCVISVVKHEKKLRRFLLPHNRLRSMVFTLFLLFLIPIGTIVICCYIFRAEFWSEYFWGTRTFLKKRVVKDENGNVKTINEMFRLKNEMNLYEGKKISIEVSSLREIGEDDYPVMSEYVVSIGNREFEVYSEFDEFTRSVPFCIERIRRNYRVIAWVRKFKNGNNYYLDCNVTENFFRSQAAVCFMLVAFYVLLFITIRSINGFNILRYLKWANITKFMRVFNIRLGRRQNISDYLRCAIECSRRLETEFDNPIFETQRFRISRNWLSYLDGGVHEICYIGTGSMLTIHSNRYDSSDPLNQECQYLRLILDEMTGTKISWIDEPINILDPRNRFLQELCRVSPSFSLILEQARSRFEEQEQQRGGQPQQQPQQRRRRQNDERADHYLSMLGFLLQGQIQSNFRRQQNEDRGREIQRMVEEIRRKNDHDLEHAFLRDDCIICAEEEKIQVSLGCCTSTICVECVGKMEKNECPFCRSEIDFKKMEIIREV